MAIVVPLALGAAGVAAIAKGAHNAHKGIKKMIRANKKIRDVKLRHKENCQSLKETSDSTNIIMDELGKQELLILSQFDRFSDLIEKVQNRPVFKDLQVDGIQIPSFHKIELKKTSQGARVLLGGLGGTAAGAFGGLAASGAVSATTVAMGTASTGTAISSLSGAAAVNATLATLGGGALAAGGGGIALGSIVLNGATLGIGILVGGTILNYTGKKIFKNAEITEKEMLLAEEKIVAACDYLDELAELAGNYLETLEQLYELYSEVYGYSSYIINRLQRDDWEKFSDEEKQALENMVYLMGMLYKMCQLKLVLQSEEGEDINELNQEEACRVIEEAEKLSGILS